MNFKEEYRKCVKIYRDTDYGNKQTVHHHNEALNRMYEIVDQASQAGSEAISDLISLPDDEISSKWIAHHLIEKTKLYLYS